MNSPARQYTQQEMELIALISAVRNRLIYHHLSQKWPTRDDTRAADWSERAWAELANTKPELVAMRELWLGVYFDGVHSEPVVEVSPAWSGAAAAAGN